MCNDGVCTVMLYLPDHEMVKVAMIALVAFLVWSLYLKIKRSVFV